MGNKPLAVAADVASEAAATSGAVEFWKSLDFGFWVWLRGEGLPEWLESHTPTTNSFAPVVLTWLAFTYCVIRHIGKRFEWEPVQVLQVYRSIQCCLFSGMGLFSMGVLYGQGVPMHAQCNDDVFIAAIINFFLWYFVADLFIMLVLIKHVRVDLLIHHGVALTGIVSLVAHKLYPCSSAPVAVTELISLFSGVEAMLPKPSVRSRGEEHVFYVIRSYRLGVLVFVRPFLWQHVRLSASTATTALQAAIYMIPGTALPMLDLVWSWKIAKTLFPSFGRWVDGGGSASKAAAGSSANGSDKKAAGGMPTRSFSSVGLTGGGVSKSD